MAAVLQVFGKLLVSIAPEAAAVATGPEWLAVWKAQGSSAVTFTRKGKWIKKRPAAQGTRIKGSRAYNMCDRGL
jgi:hypothetical protein